MLLRLLRASGAAGIAAIVVLITAVTPADAVTSPGEGSAYGASATVSVLSGVLGPAGLTVDTGRLAATNTAGPTTASAVDATLKGLVSAKVITSSARHETTSGNVTASAKLVHVALPVLAALAGRTPTASVISSQCHATSSGVTGTSDLADLDLGRIGHVSVATPNLKIGIPGVLQVIANEQIRNADGGLTVNALDIKLLGGSLAGAIGSGHIVLASSTCAPATSQPGGSGPTTTQTTPPPTTSSPSPAPTSGTTAPSAPAPGSGEVSIVPVGAPETGDGSLATVIVH